MLLEKVATYWLFCLAVIAILLLLLRGLIFLCGARRRQHGIATLHRDQRGSVQSLSFVLTLPLFIMIVMAIIQITQIMLAKVVVEYAALATARSATVWTSAHFAASLEEDDPTPEPKHAKATIGLIDQPATIGLMDQPGNPLLGDGALITLKYSDGQKRTFEIDTNEDGVTQGHVALDKIKEFMTSSEGGITGAEAVATNLNIKLYGEQADDEKLRGTLRPHPQIPNESVKVAELTLFPGEKSGNTEIQFRGPDGEPVESVYEVAVAPDPRHKRVWNAQERHSHVKFWGDKQIHLLREGTLITLEDGKGQKKTFEIDADEDGVTTGHIALDLIKSILKNERQTQPPPTPGYATLKNLEMAIVNLNAQGRRDLDIEIDPEEDSLQPGGPGENPKLAIRQMSPGQNGNTKIIFVDPIQGNVDFVDQAKHIKKTPKHSYREFENGEDVQQTSQDGIQRNCWGNDRKPATASSSSAGNETFDVYQAGDSQYERNKKIEQIEMAAHLACLPICPSRWPFNKPVDLTASGIKSLDHLERVYDAMTGGLSTTDSLAQREKESYQNITNQQPQDTGKAYLKNKLAYSMGSIDTSPNTRIDIQIEHPESEPPLNPPRDDAPNDQIYQKSYQVNPAYIYAGGVPLDLSDPLNPCPDSQDCDDAGNPLFFPDYDPSDCECDNAITYHPRYIQEAQWFLPDQIGWQDRITVTVYHDLALLPGPAKLLAKLIFASPNPEPLSGSNSPSGSRVTADQVIQKHSDRKHDATGHYTWPLKAMASTINEGELSIFRYEHERKQYAPPR